MISARELSYVDGWPTRVPLPGNTYCEDAMQDLCENFEDFKNNLSDVKHSITLSSGKEIQVEVLRMNIAHMLGIDIKHLSQEYYNDFKENVLGLNMDTHISSFKLIQRIVNNAQAVLDYDFGNNKGKILNYYKVRVKNSIYSQITNFSNLNYICLHAFDKEKYSNYSADMFFNPRSTIYFVVQSNEVISPYFFMGVVPKNDEIQSNTKDSNSISDEADGLFNIQVPYAIETLLAPTNPYDFFNSQEASIPTQIIYNKNVSLGSGEGLIKEVMGANKKIELLNLYNSIINEYNLPNYMNIYGDYIVQLSEQRKLRMK